MRFWRTRWPSAADARTSTDIGRCAVRWPSGRTRGGWNFLGILRFDLLLELRSVLNTGPATFNLRLGNFSFHSLRPDGRRRLGDPGRRSYHQLIALHFGESSGFNRGGQISAGLSLNRKPLNRPARVRADHVVIGTVIVDDVILNGDVGDVYCVGNVGNVLRWRKDSIPQDRLTDKANVTKVIIFRTNIVLHVHASPNRPSFINDAWTSWRQRRPANVIATGSP